MTAMALGGLGLEKEPLEALAPAFHGTWAARTPLELLLAHRAGLEANLPLWRPLAEAGVAVDRAAALSEAASALRSDARGPLPAEGFPPLYSDLGYLLAGEALALASASKDPGAAIERLVVAPLGLGGDLGTARTLGAQETFASRVVPTEIVPWRGGEVRGLVHDENAYALTGAGASGHAGMFGTVAAVLAFGAAALDAIVLGAGPLHHGRDLAWMIRPRPGGSLRAGFDGKSEEASSAGQRCGPRTFGHLGFTGTSLWIDPDAEVVVALLTNRVHPTRENRRIREARPWAHDELFASAREA
ncbi:MAG: hypothetical protein JWP97_4381 [Labilithrix sp.]|nr:hypothetical protein [Labilithrix sp.]